MATIVCQGSQSCFESQILEPWTLRLRLSSSKSHFSQPPELTYNSCSFDSKPEKDHVEEKCHSEENRISTNAADLGCWSFLQSMSSGTQLLSKEAVDKESTYVHPLIRRSMSTLSEKSLEICTESLGSETGTDMLEDSSIFSLSSSDSEGGGNSPTREQQRSASQRQLFGAKKASSHSFPPPLTTIRGVESLRVRSHREDGRLIIKATKAPPPHSLLQAERSNGRLRLCFLTQSPPFFDSKAEEDEAQDHTQHYQEEEENIENDRSDHDDDADADDEDEEQGGRGQHVEAYGDDEEIDAYKLGEDKNENIVDVGAEREMKKFPRPGRCKEGEPENKGLLNWESFWVATS